MPRTASNGVEIEYESFGEPGNPPLLLIMGLGAQMILWDDAFCRELASRGFHVTRFDNRDVGASTCLADAGAPDLGALIMAQMTGAPVDAPYTLSDMAADAAGLLDSLGIRSAHIVGASMGGMIAQTMAIEMPARVRSLTSIMSTTGDPSLPQATPDAMNAVLTPPAATRESNLARAVTVFRAIGSPGFPFDEARILDFAGRSFDRGFHPEGVARQIAAILASGDRTSRLASVNAPTVVIHGKADPLVPYECGVASARAISGAKLVSIEGMGHDLPVGTWPTIIAEICEIAARA
ncbi:MAG TPA: alpha/beta hydrolase [Candidatus Binatia bacterium]|jgi:pimeloyl-ACP methyl ester carboxylesterase